MTPAVQSLYDVHAPYGVVEILPGIMPKVISRIAAATRIPLICGGLIMDKGDIMEALSAGALAVSSTSESVWQL